MLKRCSTCGGTKTIKGLGMIEKKCEACLGIGSIEVDAIVNDVDAIVINVDAIPAKDEAPKKILDLTKKSKKVKDG